MASAMLVLALRAWGFIDPDRPAWWLIGECKTVVALKVATVEEGSATFAVAKVLHGDLKNKEVIVRWTATQQPPVDKRMVGEPAVLLVPKDDEDPTLIQVSPEYLSLRPVKGKEGQYDFVRLNGFVKGSFNGQAGDFIRLIEDTLAGRAYFPIWADTSFAKARRIGDLPQAAAALAVGDLDGDGRLDVLAATSEGVFAVSPDAKQTFAVRPVEGVGPAAFMQLADADGDGRCDILTDAGLFLNQGNWRFAPAAGLARRASTGSAPEHVEGQKWADARFCYVPGRPAPAIVAIEGGRARLLARGKDSAWTDISADVGMDKAPGGVLTASVGEVAGQAEVVLVTQGSLVRLAAPAGQRLQQVQAFPLVETGKPGVKNPHLCRRDLDGDGLDDLFLAHDGGARFWRRQADGALVEVPDYLGDVRKMFQPVEGCTGVVADDFNNDGLPDLVVGSKSQKVGLVMNRGYHNLREGTEIFDLPEALKEAGEVQALATGDIDGDGDLDLLVAGGKTLYLLANTFETKPQEANDRPRNPLIKVLCPNRFGSRVWLEDKDGKPLACQSVGAGPVAGVSYFGYRTVQAPSVALRTPEGNVLRAPAGRTVEFK